MEGKSVGIDGDKYYGYQETLHDVVLGNLRRFGIEPEEQSVALIGGLLQDTMQINEPVSFAMSTSIGMSRW